MNKVSIIACADYNEDAVLKAIRDSLDLLGGIKQFITPGKQVLIKPNMLTSALPDDAVCTHPSVVKAVITLVKEAHGNPIVGDSPAVGSAEKVASKNGIAEVCKKMHVPLVDFSQSQEITFLAGHVCKRFIIDKTIAESDVIINLPKLKTHGLTYFTGGVKNLYGCITGKQKAQFHLRMPNHEDFSNMLVDLYSLIRPCLTIMDGIVGMEGAGPRNGKPRKVGVVLASRSAVALDAVATSIINIKPMDIPTTKAAILRSIDIASIDEIKIIGEKAENYVIKDFLQSSAFASLKALPRPIVSFFQNNLTAKPIISEKCVGCGVCKDCCPPQVININNKKAAISYDKCIRCYCCQELCPHDAISLKRGAISKFIFN